MLKLRKDASVSGNQNVFDKFKETQTKNLNQVFGTRGRGIYQDFVLSAIEAKVAERTQRLEDTIKSRQSNERWVSGMLTLVSVGSIVVLWFKMQKVLGGKSTMAFGRSAVS